MNDLITKCLDRADIQPLMTFPGDMTSDHEKEWISWIVSYFQKYGTIPTVDRMSHQFSTFVPILPEGPLYDLAETVLAERKNLYARNVIMEHADSLKEGEDPTNWIGELSDKLRSANDEVVLYSTFDRSSYILPPKTIPYGVSFLDNVTGGISVGDVAYTIGRLGVGKTTFVEWLVKNWYVSGLRILIISNENAANDVIAKIDSFLGGWNPLRRRLGGFSEKELARIRTVSRIASASPGEIIIPKRYDKTVSGLVPLVNNYRPDIVVVDGVHLMKANPFSRGKAFWESVTEVSRGLKELALNEELPIMCVHQANRGAAGVKVKSETIAYSDAIGQDADLVLGLNPAEDQLLIETVKNRWGPNAAFFFKITYEEMWARVLEAAYVDEDE